MSEKYIAYTDGACANNQAAGGQPGGWGVAFLDGRMLSGGDPATTNNRMELTAAIEALKSTPKGSKIEIHSDSAYMINAFTQSWLNNWIKRGWKTSQGKPVENQDLWKELLPFERERDVIWVKVKGHSGDKWNDLADKLAVEAIPSRENKANQRVQIAEDEQTKRVILNLSEKHYMLLVNKLSDIGNDDAANREVYEEIVRQYNIQA